MYWCNTIQCSLSLKGYIAHCNTYILYMYSKILWQYKVWGIKTVGSVTENTGELKSNCH